MVRQTLIYILLLFTFAQPLFADSKEFQKNFVRDKQIDSLLSLASRNLPSRDTAMVALQNYFRESGDKEYLELESYFKLYYKLIDNASDTIAMYQLEEMARVSSTKYPALSARIYYFVGYHTLLNLNYYAKAFDCYIKLDELLSKYGYATIPKFAEYYNSISGLYYQFKQYRKAIAFLKRAQSVNKSFLNEDVYWSLNNNLGLYYQKLKVWDTSNYYFTLAVAHPGRHMAALTLAISKGNIGNNFYQQKDFDRALPLIQNDYTTAINFQDWGLAAGAAIPLADIYLSKNRTAEAYQLLTKADSLINVSQQFERREKLYHVLSNYYSKIGNYQQALLYKDKTLDAFRENDKQFNNMILLNVQQNEFQQRLKLQNEKYKYSQSIYRYKIIGVLAISIFALSGLYFFYYIKRKSFLAKEQQHLMEIEMQERQLAQAQQKLKSYLKELSDQAEVIDQLGKVQTREEYEDAIVTLRHKNILTESQWQEFNELFDNAFPGFSFSLLNHYPETTPAEQRILMMSLLKLDRNQMANNLGIQSETVRITWYRLRKKLKLEESIQLIDFAQSIWEKAQTAR